MRLRDGSAVVVGCERSGKPEPSGIMIANTRKRFVYN